MKRRMAVLMAAAALAAGEVFSLPASAEMPMSPVYPTTSRPKRIPAAAQPPVVATQAALERPAAPPATTAAKEAPVAPVKEDAAGPVFEAPIPPPVAATAPPPKAAPAAAEQSPPPKQKSAAAKPRPPRAVRAPRYVYDPYRSYPVASGWASGYADPYRGWGGGRYGPSPISDGH